MIPAPVISDHALLRWMERVHGIDVEGWRTLMRDDLRSALDAYDGSRPPDTAAFILSPTGEKVITVLGRGQHPSPFQCHGIPVALVTT